MRLANLGDVSRRERQTIRTFAMFSCEETFIYAGAQLSKTTIVPLLKTHESMKFGKELKASIVSAWRHKYCRYAELKVKLKELKCLYEKHDIGLETASECIPPIIRADSLVCDLKGDSSRKHTLKGTHQDLLKSMIEISDEKFEEGSMYAREYEFSKIAQAQSVDLQAMIPVFESRLHAVSLKEHEVVGMLEQDIHKVSCFYAQQCH